MTEWFIYTYSLRDRIVYLYLHHERKMSFFLFHERGNGLKWFVCTYSKTEWFTYTCFVRDRMVYLYLFHEFLKEEACSANQPLKLYYNLILFKY